MSEKDNAIPGLSAVRRVRRGHRLRERLALGLVEGAARLPGVWPSHPATIAPMAEAEGTLQEQLDEIGIQLAWVRDYL
jgi:hypothetical protein